MGFFSQIAFYNLLLLLHSTNINTTLVALSFVTAMGIDQFTQHGLYTFSLNLKTNLEEISLKTLRSAKEKFEKIYFSQESPKIVQLLFGIWGHCGPEQFISEEGRFDLPTSKVPSQYKSPIPINLSKEKHQAG